MELEVLGTVVNPVVDNDPGVVFGVVLGDLFLGEDLFLASLLGWRNGNGFFSRYGRLQESSKTSGFGLVGETRHPSALELTGLGRLFESENVLVVGVLFHVDLEAEDLVVSHAHEIPGGIGGLGHVGLVPGAADNFLAADEVGDLELIVPPGPAPVHAVVGWLLLSVERREVPVGASVGTDFDTRDHATTTGVGVSRNVVCFVNVLADWELFVVKRGCHGRVDVELVEDVFGAVPPFFGEGLFRGDMGRKDTVVVVVVVILGFVFDDVDFLEPLDHSATDVAGDDQTDGIAVIGLQFFPIGLKGDHDVVGGVHGAGERNGGSVLDLLSPRFVFEWTGAHLVGQIFDTDELNVLSPHVGLLDSGFEKQIPQADSLVDVGGNTAGTPVESNRLADLVLLFPSVSGTHESDGNFFGWSDRYQLVHGNRHGGGDFSTDVDGVLFPGQFGDGTVVSDVVQGRRREKPRLSQFGHGGFHVKWMATRQSNQSSVARKPFVRCSDVAVVRVLR
mmetsp:Transcript_12285/g.25895  ORF Transcript_12285/g.25895 Transcript_12285/m.25895 type:complete len:505 (-) Transcript_12285:513-2027(-)